MSWVGSPHRVAQSYGLDLTELLAMADYLQVDRQQSALLTTVAQAATLPLESRWSMHVAQSGQMCALSRLLWSSATAFSYHACAVCQVLA